MKTTLFRSAASLGLTTFLLCAGTSCNKEKLSTSKLGVISAASPDLPPEMVVAKIGEEKITAAQLDEKLKSQLNELDATFKKQKFEARRNGLDQLIVEKLVKVEATKKGITEQQYVKSQIQDGVTPPTEEQVKQFYEQNKAQFPPGSSFDQFRPQIVQYLSRGQQGERAKKIFDELKKKANVAVFLKEARKEVQAVGPSRGPEKAPITVVEFSDFECPFCGRAHDTMEKVMETYAGKIRLVFRQFPLSIHNNAEKAAEASLCASEQGKFWEYHDLLFKNQRKLDVPDLKEYATSLGLDTSKFAKCLDGGKISASVQSDQAAGQAVGVSGTPAFFINGVMLSGAQPFEEFQRVIDQELASR